MFEIKYHLPLFERLKPVKEWRDKPFTDAKCHTLEKAAKLVSEHTGKEITVSDFLDAASNGQIRLLVILPRTAKVEKYDGGIYCNGGTSDENIAPEGAMPHLPLTACQHLHNTGKASWRTFDGFEEAGGIVYRFTEAMLIDGEPDFETVPDDCRVYGREIHALADYLAPLAPVVPTVTTPSRRSRDLLTPLIRAAQQQCQDQSAQVIFAMLRTWAEAKPPKPPLLGVTQDGIQWKDSKDEPQELSLRNLRDRLRQRRKAA